MSTITCLPCVESRASLGAARLRSSWRSRAIAALVRGNGPGSLQPLRPRMTTPRSKPPLHFNTRRNAEPSMEPSNSPGGTEIQPRCLTPTLTRDGREPVASVRRRSSRPPTGAACCWAALVHNELPHEWTLLQDNRLQAQCRLNSRGNQVPPPPQAGTGTSSQQSRRRIQESLSRYVWSQTSP